MSGSSYQQSFFTVPYRIITLPGITIQLIRFYEKIFQFWYRDHECFIGNDELMEHCGMKSESTISKAFQFFEKAGEIKREIRPSGQRYIIQPPRKVEIVQKKNDKLSTPPLATARVTPRASETPPLATARHNNNNLNNINLSKSSCDQNPEKPKAPNAQKPPMTRSTMRTENEKRHWDDKPKAALANVSTQSTSFDPEKYRQPRASAETARHYLDQIPGIRNRRNRNHNEDGRHGCHGKAEKMPTAASLEF